MSMNENPTLWNRRSDSLKVAFVNCAGLITHFQDVQADKKLLKADLLYLDETHITDDYDVSAFDIDGFDVHFITAGKGKGIATYKAKYIKAANTSHNEQGLQIVKVSMAEVDSINVYRSSNMSIIKTRETLEKLVDMNKPTLITGDFNLCHRKYKTNVVSTGLYSSGFKQLQDKASQIMGGVIDHIYWFDPRGQWETPDIERCSPYYSDHDSFLITLRKKPEKKSKLKKRRK